MAQQFPTSAQVIYDTLAADATFTSYLGSYNFKTGDGPIAALSVITPGEDLPSIRNVQGIECIIHDAGDTQQTTYLTGDMDLRTQWSVFLVSWEPSTGAELQVAADHMLRRFNGAQMVQTVATVDGLGSLVQTKIMISSFNPIIPL